MIFFVSGNCVSPAVFVAYHHIFSGQKSQTQAQFALLHNIIATGHLQKLLNCSQAVIQIKTIVSN